MKKAISLFVACIVFVTIQAQVTLVPWSDTWKYFEGIQEASDPINAWRLDGYNDVSWNSAIAPFHYGDGITGTTITNMQYTYSTLYFRKTISIDDVSKLDSLIFNYEIDDGLIVWINGVIVLQRNAPTNPLYNSFAPLTTGEFGTVYTSKLLQSACNLVNGNNQIAVMVFNCSLTSSDIYFNMGINAIKVIPIIPIVPDTIVNRDTVSILKPSGYYTSSFSLGVSACHAGDTVLYTLDGSNPYISSTKMTGYAPFTIAINPASTTNRGTTPGVNVRAAVKKKGYLPGKIVTRTYIFMSNVLTQTDPNGSWPSPYVNNTWGNTQQYIDYDMDANVVNSVAYKDSIDDALLALPTYSITVDVDSLFNTNRGIYANALQDGELWERPANIELISSSGASGFNIDGGIRIRGGYSRVALNPKHAFRIFFKDEYGKKKLKYPLFDNEGVDEFDKFDFRTSQNYSWSYEGSALNIMVRDIFSRDMQGRMGNLYTRSRFCHLYLDGMYWGIYQTQERPSASFGQSYLGGNKSDYDVVKVETDLSTYVIGATDGTLDAWQSVYDLCNLGFTSNTNYYRIQGLDATGKRDTTLPVLVDIDNLIDYMLIIFYTGNFDSPVSKFLSDDSPNNFYAIYNKANKDQGFKFIIHDAEHALQVAATSTGTGINENRVNIGSNGSMTMSSFTKFHPQWLHYRLCSNPNYRLRFADHVYKHFYNNGVMTPAVSASMFKKRANEIKTAIIAESARWGDSKKEPAFTKANWQTEINNLISNFFPVRTDIVLQQIKDEKLYPVSLMPPTFSINSSEIKSLSITTTTGTAIQFINPAHAGTMYYTTDGTDPRLDNDAVSSIANIIADYSNYTTLNSCVLKVRVLNKGIWSAAHELSIFVPADFASLKLTEIHYHPAGIDTIIEPDDLEFIEIKNTGITAIDMKGVQIIGAVKYEFNTTYLLQPNDFIVLASKDSTFNVRYGFWPTAEYIGHLSNGGEAITATYNMYDTIFNIIYDDASPWPVEADGVGYSIVPTTVGAVDDQTNPTSWRTSFQINGSPNADDILSSISTVQNIIMNAVIYPNPVKDNLYISVFTNNSEMLTAALYSAEGRVVYQEDYSVLSNETNLIKLPIYSQHLEHGIYYLKLSSINNMLTKKVIVQ